MSSGVFEIKGYTIDYYVNGKTIGSIRVEKPDRELFGYEGKIITTLTEDVTLSNKRIIKKGTVVLTECMPICGKSKLNKLIKPFAK